MRPALLAFTPFLLAAQGAHFTAREALRAEWMRALPALDPERLGPGDRARFERARRRIEAPGMPSLLPPELANPTPEVWEAKAREAKTPQERVTALHFLDRLRSPRALAALEGLGPGDAATWPRHLHLDHLVATARVNGGQVPPELRAFLEALEQSGKGDPTRAQAARLRLVMAGLEKELLPPIPATPGRVLALLDAWNRAPWEQRKARHLELWKEAAAGAAPPALRHLGLRPEAPSPLLRTNLLARLWDGLPPEPGLREEEWPMETGFFPLPVELHRVAVLPRRPLEEGRRGAYAEELAREPRPVLAAALLPELRKRFPDQADRLRERLLAGDCPVSRAAALEDLPQAPAGTELEALVARVWEDSEFEPQQALIQAFVRWKLSEAELRERLRPWLEHPNWSCRYEAYLALRRLDPATPWPAAPAPSPAQERILRLAERLARRGRPLRLRLRFSGRRTVILRLDPINAPINVANLVQLARKGFFDGRRVPRVVPDFVVQMGSPYDTMDGGPGYTVRCENSLDWYGPGSVGMALAGKDTGGSQFFITTNATPHLTGKYTRVGEVEDPDRALPLLDELELGARIERVEVLP